MEEVVETVVEQAEALGLGTMAIPCAVGIVGGGTVAWLVARRYYKTKYEALAEAEIAEAKEFYQQFYKTGEYATPESALSATGLAASEALAVYQGGDSQPEEAIVIVEEVTETTRTNVFADRVSNDNWDQDKEDEHRASIGEDEPFIISQEEFLQNENGYQNPSLVYFAEDDVLVDEQEKPIELVDDIVGEDNLTRFGHGSKDNRILYVRNNKVGMDFEIVKNEGSYAKDVLGFQHSDGPKVRRMRGER